MIHLLFYHSQNSADVFWAVRANHNRQMTTFAVEFCHVFVLFSGIANAQAAIWIKRPL
jgi:hypothetical protein